MICNPSSTETKMKFVTTLSLSYINTRGTFSLRTARSVILDDFGVGYFGGIHSCGIIICYTTIVKNISHIYKSPST